jgi:uncharacterized protein DUF6934
MVICNMNQEKYEFSKGPEIFFYEFLSAGPKGTIKKVVRYTLIEEFPNRVYNLSFGGWDFVVIGLANKDWASFEKGINYEAFLIRRKS